MEHNANITTYSEKVSCKLFNINMELHFSFLAAPFQGHTNTKNTVLT
jgi:hypothetical protein